MSHIEEIARQAEAAFTQGITGQQFTERFDILVNSVGQLQASNVNLENSLASASRDISRRSACFNIDVFSSETFAIFISILNPGIDFPLHDTPGRYGIVKVIQGSVKISTYTAVADDNANIPVPEDVKARVDSSQGSKTVFIPVNRHYSTDLGQHNAPFILRPQEDDIHVICASGNQAAFIKVLAPPYDMANRVSTLYKVIPTAKEDAAANTWLVKSDPDNMFLCSTLSYFGPQIEL